MTSHPEIQRANRWGLPDAAQIEFVLPDVVTIVAPGPNGKPFWQFVTGRVICVNAAITIPVHVAPFLDDIWIVADGNAARTGWFNWGCESFRGIKIFSEAIHQRSEYKGDYTFWMYPNHPDQVEEFLKLPHAVDPDFFRPTETVTGIAIEFAVRRGARQINLVGVDMEGGYFNDPPDLIRDTINSYMRNSLQREIEYFQGQGIKFTAMSPTVLKL